MSIQLLVLLVPVIFGLMGFGLDLGRLYLVRGELNHAAESMAQASASKLIGTDAALDGANLAARLTLDNSSGFGNKYNFGSLPIGESTGFLNSDAPDPTYYLSAVEAIGEASGAGISEVSGATAKYSRVNLTAEAPLLFWGLLTLGQDRRTTIAAQAVAGISAPLCTACGIEPYAIAAISQADPTDFGFVVGTKYSLGFQCTAGPTPPTLPGTTQRIPYLIIDRFNDGSAFDETQQLYRIGAQGLLPSITSALSCVSVNGTEIAWASVQPRNCATNTVPAGVTSTICGIASRFDAAAPGACANVTDVDTLSSAYQADPDVADYDDYTQYTGNARRVITIPIVDTLLPAGPMTVLGFRQFLVEPTQNDVTVSPADQNGRFGVLYIGNPVPLRQGRFDGGCQLTAGPGKVVLHR